MRLRVGEAGEAAAIEHLRGLGYVILEADWRCRIGQIDIVAEDAGTLVIVEVKARRGAGFGLPQESVDARKQHKLRLLTAAYQGSTGRSAQPCRIDVIALRLNDALRVIGCEHLRNAVGGG